MEASNRAPVRRLVIPLGFLLALGLGFACFAQLDVGPDILDPQRRLAGASVTRSVEPLIASAWEATVKVMAAGKPVALGTVVAADGWIITKASEVEGQRPIGVVLHDGRALRATLAAADPDNDLALLRTSATGLKPIVWAAESRGLEVGRFIAAACPPREQPSDLLEALGEKFVELALPREEPVQAVAPPMETSGPVIRVGVVSSGRRVIGGVLGILMADAESGQVVISKVWPGSGAEAAGLQAEDLVTHVNGQPITNAAELRHAVTRHLPGHTVRITYRRRQETGVLDVTLARRETIFREAEPGWFDPQRGMQVPTSRRRDAFAAVIQHHLPIAPEHCGGPLVDLNGQAVGINIARVTRAETYAVPADEVQRSIQKMIEQARSSP